MNFIEVLRQPRLDEYAIFDLVTAFLGIYLLSPLLSKLFLKIHIKIPKKNWLFLTLPIGILFHVAIGQMTIMTKNFLNPYTHYLLKTSVLILFLLGLRGIKVKKQKHIPNILNPPEHT